jgi:hypothetical protein
MIQDCYCDGTKEAHDMEIERREANTVLGSYTLNKRVEMDVKFSIKRLLEIFASDECWHEDGRFNKIQAIKTVRTEWTHIGLKSAKELTEDFMNSVFGAKSTQNIQ